MYLNPSTGAMTGTALFSESDVVTVTASAATCTGASSSEIVSFPAQTDPYLKVTLTGSESPDWWSLDELYLRD
jgi:hypothetical protein